MKNVFLHGITAGILAAAAGIVYNKVYSEALLVDFSAVINIGAIAGSCIFGCLFAATGYYFFSRFVKKGTDTLFNILFLLLTFASFISAFSTNLPLDIEAPELFAGLTIPMHLFPVLFWLACKPLFGKQRQHNIF